MPTTKTRTAHRAFDWISALTVLAAASGCLSINDKYQLPRGQQTQEQQHTKEPPPQPPVTQAPDNTTLPANTTPPIAAETDATRGPGGTPEQPSTSWPTGDSNSTNTPTTLADSSSSTDSSSTNSSSTDSSSMDPEPQDCLEPTLCYANNKDATLNILSLVDFKAHATLFPKEPGTYNVKRVEFLTGWLAGQHEIHIRENSGSDPGQILKQASFPVFVSPAWRGASFTPPVRISSIDPHWIVWRPTWGSYASMGSPGISIPGRRQSLGSNSWRSASEPLMIQVYCCP